MSLIQIFKLAEAAFFHNLNSLTLLVDRSIRFISEGKDEILCLGPKRVDLRPRRLKYGVGVIGTLLGLGVGSGIVVILGCIRAVTNNIISFFYSLGRSFLLRWPWDESELHSSVRRHPFWAYGVGLPGVLIGAALGMALHISYKILILSVVLLIQNIIVGVRTFLYFFNCAFSQPSVQKKMPALFVFHMPGILIGSLLGGIACFSILLARFLNHTGKSFFTLAGSCLNVACGDYYFKNLGDDQRSLNKKVIGIFGYLIALSIVPLALGFFMVRKIPKILTSVCGLVMGLVVFAPCKFLVRCCSDTFSRLPKYAAKIQAFKNLYSAINTTGQFNTGKMLNKGSGRENFFRFIYKSLTFNSRSLTEEVLDTLFLLYKRSASEILFLEHFQQEIEWLKARFEASSSGCFPSEIRTQTEDIDHIAHFIRNYVFKEFQSHFNHDSKVPKHLYATYKPSSYSLFFKKRSFTLKAADINEVMPVGATGRSPLRGIDNIGIKKNRF